VTVADRNDNAPVFEFPTSDNDTLLVTTGRRHDAGPVARLNSNNNNNNNNNNSHDNVYGAVIMTEVIARVHRMTLCDAHFRDQELSGDVVCEFRCFQVFFETRSFPSV